MQIKFTDEKGNPPINKNSFQISKDDLESYEENLKWESVLVSDALQETRKRKFFAINFSIVLFPGLVGAMLAIASHLKKIDANLDEKTSYYWVTIIAISMFIGMANMISIK